MLVRTSAFRRHLERSRNAFSLQIGGLAIRSGRKPVGTRVARFRPMGLGISESPVGKRFSSGHGVASADSSPDRPDVPSASPVGVRVDTRRTSCTMSESPVFTGDSGSARAYVLRNSGICALPTTGGSRLDQSDSPLAASPPPDEPRRISRGRPISCLGTTDAFDRSRCRSIWRVSPPNSRCRTGPTQGYRFVRPGNRALLLGRPNVISRRRGAIR